MNGMDLQAILTCAALGFVACLTFIPSIRRHHTAREGQNIRSFHHTHGKTVTRFGGVGLAGAFFFAAILAAGFYWERLRFSTDGVCVIGAMAMFGLGFWDDCRPLGAKFKLASQILIAAGVYWAGVGIEQIKNPLNGETIVLGAWGFAATIMWLVAFTNLINLIDGIDGLAGGISLMLMCLLVCVGFNSHSYSTLLAAGTAGALLAFLYFNFPPAKIYMGDGGAYLLGFLIGVLTITNSHKGTVAAALLAPLFAMALPIVDVTLAILRRGLKGLPIFRPDRQHIHHRLVGIGFSRRRTLLTLYALSLVCLAMALAVFWSQGRLVPILFGVMFLIVLFSARCFGFLQDWLAVRKAVGTSLQLRKESRYALAMMTWLEMEAERCDNLQELWTSYLFVTRKLGFAQVRLVLERDADFVWKNQTSGDTDFLRRRQELRLANITAIEYSAEASAMPATVFEHLTELAAETWMKVAQRWQKANGQPIRFEPAVLNIVPLVDPGRVLVANAA